MLRILKSICVMLLIFSQSQAFVRITVPNGYSASDKFKRPDGYTLFIEPRIVVNGQSYLIFYTSHAMGVCKVLGKKKPGKAFTAGSIYGEDSYNTTEAFRPGFGDGGIPCRYNYTGGYVEELEPGNDQNCRAQIMAYVYEDGSVELLNAQTYVKRMSDLNYVRGIRDYYTAFSCK